MCWLPISFYNVNESIKYFFMFLQRDTVYFTKEGLTLPAKGFIKSMLFQFGLKHKMFVFYL